MAYRDDMEAARRRIDQLVREARESARAAEQREVELQDEITRLHTEIGRLEAELGRSREMAGPRRWQVSWLPAGVVLVAYGLSVLLAMGDADSLAWALSQVAVLAGLLGTTWSWGRRRLLWPWAAAIGVKMLIVAAWGWGWWHPAYAGIAHPGHGAPLYFFWCAPLVLLAIVLAEGLMIFRGLRPLSAPAARR